MVGEGCVAAGHIGKFLLYLTMGVSGPVFLCRDRHLVHTVRQARRGVGEFHGKPGIRHLRPCSPELDPEGLVGNHVKSRGVGKSTFYGPNRLREKLSGYLRSRQESPFLGRGFFLEKRTVCAA